MVPEKGPNAGFAADRGVVTAHRAERDRLAVVRRDFLLDPAARLSEQERAAMDRMLRELLHGIAGRLRAMLPPALAASAEGDDEALVARLAAAGLLDRADLIALLLRFAGAERIATIAATAPIAAAGARQAPLLEQLAEDRHPAVAAAAGALLGAYSRRRDAFGQPAPLLDDLPDAAAASLVNGVAAAQRRLLLVAASAAEADSALTRAVAGMLAERDAGQAVDKLAAALVAALDDAGRLDEGFAAAAGAAGEFELLVAVLAKRSSLSAEESVLLLLAGASGRMALLLRLAQLPRSSAAALLAGIGEALGIADPAAEIAHFDRLEEAAVAAELGWLARDPVYRAAVRAVEGADGQRSF